MPNEEKGNQSKSQTNTPNDAPPHTEEKLSSYIAQLEGADLQIQDQGGIVVSDQVQIARSLGGDPAIEKYPIAWPLYRHFMFYRVVVPAGKLVPLHSHEEDIFRLVIQGSLKVNNIAIEQGMWFVVRAGTEYEISTVSGYVALSAYKYICNPIQASQQTQS